VPVADAVKGERGMMRHFRYQEIEDMGLNERRKIKELQEVTVSTWRCA